MTFKKWWERERYVAIHAQTWKFRVIKYVVLILMAAGVFRWGGWASVGWTFLTLTFVSLGIHFLFRWRTKAWTENWGPYKKLDLPK